MEKGHRTIVIILGTLLILGVGLKPASAAEDHFDTAMGNIINSYIIIRQKLAQGTLEGVAAEADKIMRQAQATEKIHIQHPQHSQEVHKKYELIKEAAEHAAHLAPGDIQAVRQHFSRLSQSIIKYVQGVGQPHNINRELFTYYCPMYPSYWVQEDKDAGNPFYGPKMLKCAQLVEGPEKKQKMLHDLSKKEPELEKKHSEEHHPEG